MFESFFCWGCPIEVTIYNSQTNQTDPRSTSCYFLGYPDRFRCYRFNCPSHCTTIVESINAKLLESVITAKVLKLEICLLIEYS